MPARVKCIRDIAAEAPCCAVCVCGGEMEVGRFYSLVTLRYPQGSREYLKKKTAVLARVIVHLSVSAANWSGPGRQMSDHQAKLSGRFSRNV